MQGVNSVRGLFSLYEQTPGSLLFGLTGTKAAAVERDLPDVIAVCDKAIEAAEEFYVVNAAWERTKNLPKSRGEGEAVALDPLLDKAVSGLQEQAGNPVRSLPKEHDLAIAGREFLRLALPNGAEGITKLPHAEELVAVQELLKRCDDPSDLGPYVQRLNLSPFVEHMRDLAGRFETALRKPPKGETSWDKVKATGIEAQERLAEVVAEIIGKFHERTPEHVEARSDLLFPILEQDERIGAARRNRRPVTDVDPNTGEPVVTPPAEPTEPVPPVDHA